MLTRLQKKQQIQDGSEELKKSRSFLLVNFDKIPTADLRNLRLLLREYQSKFKVIKKRLLNIVFKDNKVALDPTKFSSQVGTIFIVSDIYSIAGRIYKFLKDLAKAKKNMELLAVYDLENKKEISLEDFNKIAKLPTKEVLLTQLAFILTMPIKKLMLAINGRKEKV